MFHRLTIATTAVIALVILARPSQGALVYDSAGFEPTANPSRFSSGALEGQDATFGPWNTDNNVSTASVETTTIQSGVQAVRVDRAASVNGDQRWSIFKPTTPTLRYLSVSWDQNVSQTSLAGVAHGPLFGVEAYDDTGGATVPLVGASFVDSATGTVYYQARTTGSLTSSGTAVTFGRWNHFALQADFNTGTYQLYLNGSQIASDGFVDPGITGFSDAPLTTVAYSDGIGANATASGTAYFDNYVITTSATAMPEPAMLGAVVVPIILVARRIRRRALR